MPWFKVLSVLSAARIAVGDLQATADWFKVVQNSIIHFFPGILQTRFKNHPRLTLPTTAFTF